MRVQVRLTRSAQRLISARVAQRVSPAGSAHRYTAFLGALNINLPAEKGRLAVTTTQTYIHKDFDPKLYKNDIALLLLPREVKLSGA